jgi:hypothetical protein
MTILSENIDAKLQDAWKHKYHFHENCIDLNIIEY